jgi:hypothetical protein
VAGAYFGDPERVLRVVFLDFGDGQPQDFQVQVARLCHALFEGYVGFSTVRPRDWPSKYEEVSIGSDLSWYGLNAIGIGFAQPVWRYPRPLSLQNPERLYVAGGMKVEVTVTTVGHEMGHAVGLQHVSDDPDNVMYELPGVGGPFKNWNRPPQKETWRSGLARRSGLE